LNRKINNIKRNMYIYYNKINKDEIIKAYEHLKGQL